MASLTAVPERVSPRLHSLEGRQSAAYYIDLPAGGWVAAEARSVGNDIDMQVLGPRGARITQDVGKDDHPICVFTPRQRGVYRIKIVNNEPHPVEYTLFVEHHPRKESR